MLRKKEEAAAPWFVSMDRNLLSRRGVVWGGNRVWAHARVRICVFRGAENGLNPRRLRPRFFAVQKNEEAAAPWSVDGGHLVDLTAVIG
ncbi:MAG TPA: hypothetical protein VGB12_09840 [bacterium]